MNRLHSGVRVAVLAMLAAMACSASAAGRPWPDSSAAILVFADQLPSGLTEAQRAFAATRLAGTQKQRLSEIRALRVYNPDFLCLHYQLAVGSGPSAFIIGDEWTSDWAAVNAQEGWFLHNPSGQRVHQSAWNWDVMDVSFTGDTPATGFPAYWIQTSLSRARAAEADGVFADSYTPDAYTFGQSNPSHPWFEDVDACKTGWIPLLNRFGTSVRTAFDADPSGIRFLPNLGGLITSWDTTDYAVGHGGMIEGFSLWSSGNFFPESDWRLQIDRALALTRAGKIVICQSYPDASDLGGRMFVTASYLLVKGTQTYLSLLGLNDMSLEYYPEYRLNLGPAAQAPAASIDALFDAAWGVYRRDFANGIVCVNPGETTVSIPALGATYRRVTATGGGAVGPAGAMPGGLSYSSVTSLSLPPHSGAVLLRSGSWARTLLVTPWLQDVAAGCYTSVQAAVNAALPGDTVLVRSGVYREQVVMPRSGTPEAWITLAVYPGERPVLDGAAGLNTIIVENQSYIHIEGFEILDSEGDDPPAPVYAGLGVAASPAEGGTVNGAGSYLVGAAVTIRASPSSGWRLDRWSDGLTNEVRTVTVPEGGTAYTAFFVTNPPASSYSPVGTVLELRPVFTWPGSPDLSYRITLTRNRVTWLIGKVTGCTSWTPPRNLKRGNYRWLVRTYRGKTLLAVSPWQSFAKP